MHNVPETRLYDTPLLRQLIDIRFKLPPALFKVADLILRDPLNSSILDIKAFAKATDTSVAAINRLGNALGLDGFTGLHLALQQNFMHWVVPVEKVRAELLADRNHDYSLDQQVRVAKGNLDTLIECNSPGMFDAIVEALDFAEHVYVLGFGNSYHIAGLFTDWLLPCIPNSTLIKVDAGIDVAAHRITAIGSDDVLVAISLPDYAPETTHLARYAKAVGVQVVALVDSPASPVSAIANYRLYTATTHPQLANSKVALLTAIEALVAAVQRRRAGHLDHANKQARTALAFIKGEEVPQASLRDHGPYRDPLDHPDMPPRKRRRR
jgi:DNA-binding MurR/RpiR family transcriptional regulator